MKESERFVELKDAIRASLARGDFDSALLAADAACAEARETGDTEAVDLATCNRVAVLIERPG